MTHDSDYHEPVEYHDLPANGSSRLQDKGMSRPTINPPTKKARQLNRYGRKRYVIDQCGLEFNEKDPREGRSDHITKRHPQSFPRRRGFKTGYGNGGRENLIPLDGTFLERFVKQLSQNENIQGTKETADIIPHSETYYTKELDPGKSTNEGEAMEVLNEQSDHVGATVEDEIMEGCQEAAGEQRMEEDDCYVKEYGYEETAVEDEAMGEHKNAAGERCTEGEAITEDDQIDQLMETDREVFGKGEVSTKYEVMVEPM